MSTMDNSDVRTIRVLIVEDNPGDANLTKEILEVSKFFLSISVVMDGKEAIDYLLHKVSYSELPDLIILDLNLPKLDGRQVLAEIKKHDNLATIPIVVLTSSDAERDIIHSYKLGANCYITKPVDLKSFQSIVRSIEGFWFTVVKLP